MISIIIPAYNREKLISRTLDSILNQSYKDWECFVVDDSSTDATWNIILEYASKDTRFIPLKNERRKGACGARNTGIKYANGDYLHFFDSDDKMYPTMLESLKNKFVDGVDVVTCWTNVIDIDTNEPVKYFKNITEGNIHKALMIGKTYVDTNCALIRRHVVEIIGGWSEDCPSYQEWDFHLRLSKSAKYTTFPQCMIEYYIGGNDSISSSNVKGVKGVLYILRKFRNEWIINHPINYLKRLYGVYCQVIMVREISSQAELLVIYKQKIIFPIRLIVKLLYRIFGDKR